MFASKKMMEFLPNIHLLSMFIILFTLQYRVKALVPLYVYVFLDGLFSGFSLWWIPYTYIWTILWAGAMLIPKGKSKLFYMIVCPVTGGLHGILFGTLYAPFWAIIMHLDFNGFIAYIINGLSFDVLHAIGNIASCTLVCPLYVALDKAERKYIRSDVRNGQDCSIR